MTVSYRKVVLFIISCLFSLSLHAQLSMDYNQLPPGNEWYKLTSSRFTLYYPPAMEFSALRTASFLERNLPKIGASLNSSIKPFSIVINNKYGLVNGMVTFLPFRSEWYHTAPQSSFTHNESWFDVLGIHEMRHVAQFNRMNTGAIKAAYYLTGEPGQALLSGMAYPAWFFEGDAVLTETLLSEGGRGRTPAFQKNLRAQLKDESLFSYQKQLMGSYRDYTGNYYDLGYFMMAWLRKHTDSGSFQRLLESTSFWAFWPWSFQKALKKELSLSLYDIYEAAFQDAALGWAGKEPYILEDELYSGQKADKISSYNLSGIWINGLIAYNRRPDRPGSIVYLKDGQEILLTRAVPESNISLQGNSLIWCEFRRNPRWGKVVYSVPVIYDLESGQKRDIISNDWLYYPSFSPDGKSLVCVRISESSRHSLVIYDRETDLITKELKFDFQTEIMNPFWSDEGIVFIHKKDRKGQIRIWDAESGDSEVIKNYSTEVLLKPSIHNRSLFYISSASGIMNLYEESLDTGTVISVSSVSFDLNSYTLNGPDLYYTSWTQKGSKIYERENFSENRPSLLVSDSAFWAAFESLETFEEKASFSSDIMSSFSPEKVSWHEDLLSWNSWGLWMEDSDNIGLYAESRNLMNTLIVHASGQVNYQGGEPGGVVTFDFARFYPVLSLNLSSLQQTEDSEETYHYRLSQAVFDVSVPYIRDKGDYTQIYTTSLSAGMLYYSDFENILISDKFLMPVTAGAGVKVSGPAALQDMEQVRTAFLYGWYDYLFEEDQQSSLVTFSSYTALPLGNLPFSLSTALNAEYAFEGSSGINSRVSPVHGLSFPGNQTRVFGRAVLGLPPVFPDVPLFSLYYLKAVWCNVFAESAISADELQNIWFHNDAYGVEFWTRQMFFNLPVPIDFGTAIVYKPESSWGRKSGTDFYMNIRLPI